MKKGSPAWQKLHKEITTRYTCVAGLDEAGRGPLAGPVVCAAVILNEGTKLPGLDDSKLLAKKSRERLYALITKKCAYGIAVVGAAIIDSVGMRAACELGFREALTQLSPQPDFLLIDGRDRWSLSVPFKTLVKGDQIVRAIAAASVLAKVHRDMLMQEFAKCYPHYRFEKHKGYGTREHMALLQKHGPSPIHRKSFGPVFEVENVQQLPMK